MDNDDWKDIIVSNGIKKDLDNNDYRAKVQSLDKNATVDDLFQLSKDKPPKPISNHTFRNKGNLEFEKFIKDWGFGIPSFSNGMAYRDLDNDGYLDLFVGTRLIAWQYTYPATSYRLINENGNFKKAKSKTVIVLSDIGMVTDAVFTDIDLDGDEDVMIVGEWMEIKVLTNTGGVFEDESENYGLNSSRGIWWSITTGDLVGNGDDDYVIGNIGKIISSKLQKSIHLKSMQMILKIMEQMM